MAVIEWGRRACGLAVVAALTCQAHVEASNATNPSFAFDGWSSDVAQQFYNLNARGVRVSPPTLPLGVQLPDALLQRLTGRDIKFTALPEALQHALLWDSGVVPVGSGFAQVRVACSAQDQTMADIALDRASVNSLRCDFTTCFAVEARRMANCNQDDLARVVKCAVETDQFIPGAQPTAMWATGGDSTIVPNVFLHRHDDVHTASSIITLNMVELLDLRSCPFTAAQSAIIVPCVSMTTARSRSDWCAPKPGALVTNWLNQVAPASPKAATSSAPAGTAAAPNTATTTSSKSKSHSDLFIGLAIGVAAAALVGGAIWFVRRRRRAEAETAQSDPTASHFAAMPSHDAKTAMN